jgi:carboxymethylenebutenolidase
MCHGPTSRPPMPPVSGGAGGGRRVVLEASDGNRFAAFMATTEIVDAPGVVILPDVRGLHPFYEELALRFGDAGVHALALDYYGRTAGTGSRGGDFDHRPHFQQATDANVGLDVAAAVAYLRSSEGGGATAVFTVGFCFGGRLSFNQAASPQGLAGVVGFYGRVAEAEPGDSTAPVVQAPRYRCPVLGLFGGADPAITAGHVAAFREVLDAGRIRNQLVVYQGAPHSFFDRAFTTTHERPRMPGDGCSPSSTGIQAMGSSPGQGAFREPNAVYFEVFRVGVTLAVCEVASSSLELVSLGYVKLNI